MDPALTLPSGVLSRLEASRERTSSAGSSHMRKDSALPPSRWRSGDSGGCYSGGSSGGPAFGSAPGSALRPKGTVAYAHDIEREQVATTHDVGER